MADKLFSALGARAAVLTTDITALLPAAGPPAEQATIAQLITLLNSINGAGPYLPLAGGTMTGRLVNSTAGASLASPLLLSGTIFTGGGTTNTKPQLLVEPAGTTSAAWNNLGTLLGINAPVGFTGTLIEAQLNGVSRFKVAPDGQLDITAALKTNTSVQATSGLYPGTSARSFIQSSTNGNLTFTNAAGADFSLLQFGGTTSAFPAIKRSTTELHFRLADDSGFTAIYASSVVASGALISSARVETGLAGNFTWLGSSRMLSGTDGVILLQNNAVNNFGRLQFGGTTSSFPSIKRSGAGLEFRLADDSAYAVITASMLRLTPALTVATLPAAGTQGRIAYVTDALAPAFLAVVVGGGAIITTVFDNGTNWVSV